MFTEQDLKDKGYIEVDGKWIRPTEQRHKELKNEIAPKKSGGRRKTNKGRIAGRFNSNRNYEGYEGREDDLQKEVKKYIEAKYPTVFFIHVPNGGKRSKAEAGIFKAMGVKAGIPDILIFDSGNDKYSHHKGLSIELKNRNGVVSDKQFECMEELTKRNWRCVVCWNMEEIILVLNNYFRLKS